MGAPILYFQHQTLTPAQDGPSRVTGDTEPGLEPGVTRTGAGGEQVTLCIRG